MAATAIEHRQAVLDQFVQEVCGPEKKKTDWQPLPVEPLDLSDEELLKLAREANNGAKFSRLFDRGDITGYSSPSEADLALCGLLAFWFGRDKGRMNRVFKCSKLYREKWDRADYSSATLDKAIKETEEVYKPPKPKPETGNGGCEPPPIEWEPGYSQQTSRQTDDKDVVRPVSCREILERQFHHKPLLKGLLDEKESLVVVGQSGLGKSLFGLNMTIRAGASQDMPISLFDRFGISEPLVSLFIQSENPIAAKQRRIAKIIEDAPWLQEGLERVFFAGIRDDIRLAGAVTDQKFQFGLLSLIDQTHANILLLDPLISYHTADENDNGAMRRTLDCLTAICDKADVACVIFHHSSKAGTDNQVFAGRGASAIGDWAANILVLSPGPEMRREDGSRRFIMEVSHRKSRNYETAEPFYLERINGALLVPIHPQELDQKRIKRIEAVLGVLTEHNGFIDHKEILIAELMKRSNVSRGTAQNSIKAALEDSKVFIVPINRKQSGYRLPDVQPNIEVENDY